MREPTTTMPEGLAALPQESPRVSPDHGQRWRMLGQPVQPEPLPQGLDALWQAATGRLRGLRPRTRGYLKRGERIVKLGEAQFGHADEAAIREAAGPLHQAFKLNRAGADELDLGLALVSHAARLTLGMTPRREQVAAALVLLDGCVGELATGEGKTLVATLAAVIAGWHGRGCHVITVNDYLAGRDAQWMGPTYRMCGLSVGCVQGDTPPPQRREAYAADITYGTNKEMAADFLRDRLALGTHRSLSSALLKGYGTEAAGAGEKLTMRGLAWAIIDEADSVLIDEAVTPLIISGNSPNAEQTEAYQQAAEMARQLHEGVHYKLDHRWREVNLTPRGEALLEKLAEGLGGIWAGKRRREELANQALVARELFLRDKQYVIQEGKIVIVDGFTGRLMPDRTWRAGLHQAVEAKEGLEVQPPKQTLARISFQRFFRLYRRLSGMTGTGWESRHELWQTYQLPVVRLPTHRPSQRRRLPDQLFTRAEDRWQAVVQQVQQLHDAGRPVLVGTRSVQASERISVELESRGLSHQVLNARRHEEEATIVGEAGQPGRITVATNMAGRGTDIKLGEGVAEAGGLHVIMTECHESGRVDRQLFGRAARQGDPGSAAAMLTVDDELLRRYAGRGYGLVLRLLATRRGGMARPMHRLMLRLVQQRAERGGRRQRRSVVRSDDWLDTNLAFAGREL